jgi:ATP-dependent Zn protease
MKKISLFFLTTLLLLAEEESQHTFFSDLMSKLIPIVIFFGIFIFLARKMNKKYGAQAAIDSNNKLTESNEKLTSELKRVADALEKKEKE